MMEQILVKEITSGPRKFSLSLGKEDLSAVYPGFFRYSLTVSLAGSVVALFRTNTYEYAPGVPLHAEAVAIEKAGKWEQELHNDPDGFLERHVPTREAPVMHPRYDVVIIQASPRAGGNSGTLAGWAEDAARESGVSFTVLYPHDMDIRECIGCYQCFNTGSCIYDDDMGGIIDLVNMCRLLVICTPVYTNAVPANLKILIDRFQSYSAAHSLGLMTPGKTTGMILSVSGRPGQDNFFCVRKEITAFFHIAGVSPGRNIFIDGVDRIHDILKVPGCRERVKDRVRECLKSSMPATTPKTT